MGEMSYSNNVEVDEKCILSSTHDRFFYTPTNKSMIILEYSPNSPHDKLNHVVVVHKNNMNPIESWLPITESRNGSAFSVTCLLLCSGIGFQALLLPYAFATLGWVWGSICLLLAFVWQLYTIWLLVNLHESAASGSGLRISRYLQLSITAFGEKLGKLLAIFPVMYLSGGTCCILIIKGGGTMRLFLETLCSNNGFKSCDAAKSLNGIYWFLIFTCLAIAVAQLPNMNSVARISVIGVITGLVYITLLLALSISKCIPSDSNISYHPLQIEQTGMGRFSGILNAIGIIFLSFRGHNLILEIQGTISSSPKRPSKMTMWKGVTISYALIAICFSAIAVGGFWTYGDEMPANGGLMNAISDIKRHDKSKTLMVLIYLIMVMINSLSTFPIYAMVVFDNLELRYVSKKKKKCPWWVRTLIRLLFGGLLFFMAVAFPFLPSLASLIGGIVLPLTYVYPCFMWIAIKKPKTNGDMPMWYTNLVLGFSGFILSVLLVVASSWNLAQQGLHANFFKP